MRFRSVFGFIVSIVLSTPVGALALQLPSDVPINADAGRGGLLIVNVRLGEEEFPFIVDTGTSVCLIDKTLEPKLGKPVEQAVTHSWGKNTTNNVYETPKLSLGGVPLVMSKSIVAYDLQPFARQLGKPLKGILGMDCLWHYCVQLDFRAGKMRFIHDETIKTNGWGKAFPIVYVNPGDARPGVQENLCGMHGPHSLIDSGYDSDGWLMPKYFQQWTNAAAAAPNGALRPTAVFSGEKYSKAWINRNDVEVDGIGIRFLARHLVTLDFPKKTLYLRRQSQWQRFNSKPAWSLVSPHFLP